MPIGVVAYFQTAKLQEETRLRSQLSLVALTEAEAQTAAEYQNDLYATYCVPVKVR